MPNMSNEKLVRRQYSIFNGRQGNPNWQEESNALFSPDCVIEDTAQGKTYQGHAGLAEFLNGWTSVLPNARVEQISVEARNEDIVDAHFTGVGNFTGVLSTPQGDIQGDGREVTLEIHDVHQVKNGKIINSKSFYNREQLSTKLTAKATD